MTDRLSPRRLRDDERDAFLQPLLRGMHSTDADIAAERETEGPWIETDRSLVVEDAGRLVATSTVFTLGWAVPGATADLAGISYVAVAPTHRRRGLATQVVGAQLRALADDPAREAVGALWATEAPIYGRFGFGQATSHVGLDLRGRAPAFARTVPRLGVRADLATALREDVDAVWAQAWTSRPGSLDRTRGGRAAVRFTDLDATRGGGTARQAVVVDGPDEPRGYALFRGRGGWTDAGVPDATLDVEEVVGLGPDATAALWRYLLDVDLVTRWTAPRLPADDPLPLLLANPRTASRCQKDGLWVRLARVGDALAARRYATDVDVVLEVADALLPANAGRWHLVGGPDGATCEPTRASPHLSLDVADLGRSYLGGPDLASLAPAGRVVEQVPGALGAASLALRWPVTPWCFDIF